MQAFRRLLETFVAIIESRVALASVEVREERARIIIILMLAGVAMFAGALAVVSLTALVLFLCWPHVVWTLAGVVIFYTCLALLGWRALQRELDKPLFADTIDQLKKDREWLNPRH